MAVALVGTPLALSLGVPIGTWVGALFGWRLPFIAMSAIALVLVGWILLSVPDFPGNSEKQARSVRQVFTVPGMRPILAVVLTWMLGHNILYTYIEPYLRSIGMASHVAVALLFFGVGALAGIWLVGGLVDQYLRRLVLGSLAVFALIAAILLAAGAAPWLIYPVTLIWGVTFGGAATLLQTASADTAGADADIAQSMIVTGWNAAIAGGGIGGGLLLNLLGPQAFAPAVLLLALVGFLIALSARRHGFPGGGRS